ncbi:hypothetical protein [Veillonella magna]|uniref:Uncharacterized protein n=1 Tax=Veillonella magna TaxID=464322 RepID=A0ABS2GF64_9FIRM|nr:hypothetical protein [Veillonella magna]MBM6823578.1 hypothetical protein [Veillonella magna]MBM6911922.1 hypothetical protein [Veillonella magna]
MIDVDMNEQQPDETFAGSMDTESSETTDNTTSNDSVTEEDAEDMEKVTLDAPDPPKAPPEDPQKNPSAMVESESVNPAVSQTVAPIDYLALLEDQNFSEFMVKAISNYLTKDSSLAEQLASMASTANQANASVKSIADNAEQLENMLRNRFLTRLPNELYGVVEENADRISSHYYDLVNTTYKESIVNASANLSNLTKILEKKHIQVLEKYTKPLGVFNIMLGLLFISLCLNFAIILKLYR